LQHLQKTGGWGPIRSEPSHLPYGALEWTQVLSFQILAHSSALTKNSTLLFSSDSALLPKTTWVGGECPQFPILPSANPLCAQRLCVIFFPSVIPVPAATWLGARATFVRCPLPFPHRCILFIPRLPALFSLGCPRAWNGLLLQSLVTVRYRPALTNAMTP